MQLLVFVTGLVRRSYLAIALPVGFAVAALSAVAFWVGYTMAYARWEDDEEPTIPRRRARRRLTRHLYRHHPLPQQQLDLSDLGGVDVSE